MNWLTVGEVAAELRVSHMSVYRLCHSGQLPFVRVGKLLRIRQEDLAEYLAGDTVAP